MQSCNASGATHNRSLHLQALSLPFYDTNSAANVACLPSHGCRRLSRQQPPRASLTSSGRQQAQPATYATVPRLKGDDAGQLALPAALRAAAPTAGGAAARGEQRRAAPACAAWPDHQQQRQVGDGGGACTLLGFQALSQHLPLITLLRVVQRKGRRGRNGEGERVLSSLCLTNNQLPCVCRALPAGSFLHPTHLSGCHLDP